MEFQDVVRRRRMIRDYTDEPVDPATVDRALANAVRAPSAGFSQGWAFLVLDQSFPTAGCRACRPPRWW
jgi:nitroreductase